LEPWEKILNPSKRTRSFKQLNSVFILKPIMINTALACGKSVSMWIVRYAIKSRERETKGYQDRLADFLTNRECGMTGAVWFSSKPLIAVRANPSMA